MNLIGSDLPCTNNKTTGKSSFLILYRCARSEFSLLPKSFTPTVAIKRSCESLVSAATVAYCSCLPPYGNATSNFTSTALNLEII